LDTYENIIQSPYPPKTFIDAGANFGMHSLIFSKLGVRTVAFEPNPVCGAYAATISALNEVAPEWHPVALGSGDGSIDLFFPERETWLGTTVSNIADNLGAELRVVSVPLKALDTYSDSITDPVLIKIDVEGAESDVLAGMKEAVSRASCRFVCCELHPELGGLTPDASRDFLRASGFVGFRVVPREREFLLLAWKPS